MVVVVVAVSTGFAEDVKEPSARSKYHLEIIVGNG